MVTMYDCVPCRFPKKVTAPAGVFPGELSFLKDLRLLRVIRVLRVARILQKSRSLRWDVLLVVVLGGVQLLGVGKKLAGKCLKTLPFFSGFRNAFSISFWPIATAKRCRTVEHP
jgi:hypothetical protein